MVRLEDALMEGTAFSIEEESFDASLLPRNSRSLERRCSIGR